MSRSLLSPAAPFPTFPPQSIRNSNVPISRVAGVGRGQGFPQGRHRGPRSLPLAVCQGPEPLSKCTSTRRVGPGSHPAPPRPSCSSRSLGKNLWEHLALSRQYTLARAQFGLSLSLRRASPCPAPCILDVGHPQPRQAGPPGPVLQHPSCRLPPPPPSCLSPRLSPRIPEDFVRVPQANITPTLAQTV